MMLVKAYTSISQNCRGLSSRRLVASSIIAISILYGCSENNGDFDSAGTEAARSRLINEIGEHVIVHAYSEFENQVIELSNKAGLFCGAPDTDSLQRLRSSWRNTMAAWMRTESFRLGPVIDDLLDYKINFQPVNPGQVEEIIANSEPQTLPEDYLINGSVARKGLPAIEYLIFPSVNANDDAEQSILVQFEGSNRRCEYLLAVTHDLVLSARNLLSAWIDDSAGYLFVWQNAGVASETYVTVQQAVDTLVTAMAASLELVKNRKLREPAGLEADGTPRPGKVESLLSQNSLDNVRNNLLGFQALYLNEASGENLYGFDDYLDESNMSELDQKIQDQIDKALYVIDQVPEPLTTAVVSDNEKVRIAYSAVRELLRLIKQSLADELQVVIGFNSADGD